MAHSQKSQGFSQSNRQAYRPFLVQTGWRHWLSGLVSNPATGLISHSKLWANVAAGAMTWKFIQTPNPPEWLWWAYGGMVGCYALFKRGIATAPQIAEIKKENNG